MLSVRATEPAESKTRKRRRRAAATPAPRNRQGQRGGGWSRSVRSSRSGPAAWMRQPPPQGGWGQCEARTDKIMDDFVTALDRLEHVREGHWHFARGFAERETGKSRTGSLTSFANAKRTPTRCELRSRVGLLILQKADTTKRRSLHPRCVR